MNPEQIQPSDAALVQAAKPWLSRPNVVGLSVGPKTIGGRATRHRAITQPGDSGCAYVALTDGKVVGLHVGGGAYSFGCQLQPF